MSDFKFSNNQQEVIDCVVDWYSVMTTSMPYITLGGYAGTGKTTVIAEIIRVLTLHKYAKVAACCLTGKAVGVLQKKLEKQNVSHLISSISTIHKLIYTPIIDAMGEVTGFELVPKKRLMDISLIVVDEASMVSNDLYEDLLSFEIPILFVGDHGQLGPVETNSYVLPFNLMRKPSLKLEEVFRFGSSSDLIDLSDRIRKGYPIPSDFSSPHIRSFNYNNIDWEWLKSDTNSEIIITGTNKTRNYINEAVRKSRGYPCDCPIVGDKLIITKNIYSKMSQDTIMFNGQFARIESMSWNESSHVDALHCSLALEGIGFPIKNVVLNLAKLTEGTTAFPYKGDADLGNITQKKGLIYSEANYGYSITCHKAQGSEWDSVLVFDDGFPFKEEEHARWLYTAITRTSNKIGYCRTGLKEISSSKTFKNINGYSTKI